MATDLDPVIRHRLVPDQMDALVDALVVMLEAPGQLVRISAQNGDLGALLPPVAFDVILDSLSLLASRGGCAMMVLDDSQSVSVSDWPRTLGQGHAVIVKSLAEMDVAAAPRDDGRGSLYRLAEVLDAYRAGRARGIAGEEEAEPGPAADGVRRP